MRPRQGPGRGHMPVKFCSQCPLQKAAMYTSCQADENHKVEFIHEVYTLAYELPRIHP